MEEVPDSKGCFAKRSEACLSDDDDSRKAENQNKTNLQSVNTTKYSLAEKTTSFCKRPRQPKITPTRRKALSIVIQRKLLSPIKTTVQTNGQSTSKLCSTDKDQLNWQSPFAPMKRRKITLSNEYNEAAEENNFTIECSNSSDSEYEPFDTSKDTTIKTELDLLLELAQNMTKDDERSEDHNSTFKKLEKRKSTRGRKGGHAERMQRIVQKARTGQKFLLYEKRSQLVSGTILNVVDVQESFGVYMALVKHEWEEVSYAFEKPFGVILPSNLVSKVKAGCKLEGFCDLPPIRIEHPLVDEVYIQPHKLLLINNEK